MPSAGLGRMELTLPLSPQTFFSLQQPRNGAERVEGGRKTQRKRGGSKGEEEREGGRKREGGRERREGGRLKREEGGRSSEGRDGRGNGKRYWLESTFRKASTVLE